MKRKIFTFVSTLALSAALIVSAQAASAPCSARSRSFCYPSSVCLPCAPSGCITLPCPSAPETPDEPETPDTPDTPDTPETPDPPDTPSMPDMPDTGSTSSFAQQVLTLVNRERAAHGLSVLRLDDTLSRYAAVKSQDMHDNGYFSHTSPTYGSPFDMMKSFGITYNYAGENIAMGYSSPEAVMTAWMNSAGHRANILSANFTTLGVGYVADGGYWTQWFIG